MVLALAALLLAADSPRVIVSGAPAASLTALSATATDRYDAAWVPLFVAVPLSDALTLDLEAELGLLSLSGFGANVGWSLKLSAGPTWFPLSGSLSGFYVGPRFQFMAASASTDVNLLPGPPCGACFGENGPVDFGTDVRRAFLAGIDIGWQFRYRALVFGPVLGASVGYGFNTASTFMGPFSTKPFRAPPRRDGDRFVFALNVNVFKLGVAF